MNENDWWKDLKESLKFYATQAIRIPLHFAFVALWMISEWGLEHIKNQFGPTGKINKLVFQALQIIISVSILVPLAIHVCLDMRMMIQRLQRKNQYERDLDRAKQESVRIFTRRLAVFLALVLLNFLLFGVLFLIARLREKALPEQMPTPEPFPIPVPTPTPFLIPIPILTPPLQPQPF